MNKGYQSFVTPNTLPSLMSYEDIVVSALHTQRFICTRYADKTDLTELKLNAKQECVCCERLKHCRYYPWTAIAEEAKKKVGVCV